MINIDKSELQCKKCNFSYRAEILEVRKELQATTEVPRWFQKWKDEQETTTEVPVWFRNWKDQQATAKEGPMWFQKWKEETEGKRKPGKKRGPRGAFAKLIEVYKHEIEAMKRIKRKIISWVFPKSGIVFVE